MFSLIRVPFAALSLLVSANATPNGAANRDVVFSSIKNHTLFVSAERTVSFKEKYESWGLQREGISVELFGYAMKGYERMFNNGMLENTGVITIVDFSKPSSQKRLYVIDTETGRVLYKTLVAHGKNSGKEYARSFSNKTSSFASSPGFYVTADTYFGKHGYSLRLNGCEKGINDNAYKRAIVVHGADYVSESFIRENGYLGRSYGCPAIPVNISEALIEKIKNGSCLFIYAPVKKYFKKSAMIK